MEVRSDRCGIDTFITQSVWLSTALDNVRRFHVRLQYINLLRKRRGSGRRLPLCRATCTWLFIECTESLFLSLSLFACVNVSLANSLCIGLPASTGNLKLTKWVEIIKCKYPSFLNRSLHSHSVFTVWERFI